MSVTGGVSHNVMMITIKGQNKVRRYWPGKAPEWADNTDEDVDIRTALEKAFPGRDDVDITREDDPRLRRLAEHMFDDKEEVIAGRRRIRQAESVLMIEEESTRQKRLDLEEEDEDALDEKRRRIRDELPRRQQEEAAALLPEEEEEEEWEYEVDSEEEQSGTIAMINPTFVPNSERDTIAERERIEAAERAPQEMEKRRLENRKWETRQIVVDEIRKDEEIIQKNDLDAEANTPDVDTDDEVNEAEAYEAWKSRKMARKSREITQNKRDKEAMSKEEEEIKKVRNLTEEERQEWDRKNPKHTTPKRKWRFLQKYYHKGAFFQSEVDDIYTRDFSAPTGEDRIDKTKLPMAMQVHKFGRRGRTKWTHLLNEDTTNWNSPWNYNDLLRKKYNEKMAGMDAPIARPKGSKKLKVSQVQ